MTSAAWTVVAGVGVAVVWAVTKWVVEAIALKVVTNLVDSLQPLWQADLEEALEDAMEPIRAEVTTNGGGSLKDRVLSVERQLEQLLTADR